MEVPRHRHAAPADAKGGMHVGLGPVHDLPQLVPIGDLFERQMFDGCAGDDQTVEFLVLHVLKGPVEFLHMGGGRMTRLVFGHADQGQIDLQRRRADQPGKLSFGRDLHRHQVQQANPQRTDVLMRGRIFRQNHHAFVVEHVIGGQVAGQGDGHGSICVRRSGIDDGEGQS